MFTTDCEECGMLSKIRNYPCPHTAVYIATKDIERSLKLGLEYREFIRKNNGGKVHIWVNNENK